MRVVVTLVDDELPGNSSTLMCGVEHVENMEDVPIALGRALGNFFRHIVAERVLASSYSSDAE